MNGINLWERPPFYRDRYEGRERPLQDAYKEGEKILAHCDASAKKEVKENLAYVFYGKFDYGHEEAIFSILKSQSIEKFSFNLKIFRDCVEMPWFLLGCVGYSNNYKCHINRKEFITLLVSWHLVNIVNIQKCHSIYLDLKIKEVVPFLSIYIRQNGQMRCYDLNKTNQLFNQLSKEFEGRHILESASLAVPCLLDQGPDIQIRYTKDSVSTLVIPSAHYLERIFAIVRGSATLSLMPVITGLNSVATDNKQYNLRVDVFFKYHEPLIKRIYSIFGYVSDFLSAAFNYVRSPSNLVPLEEMEERFSLISFNEQSSLGDEPLYAGPITSLKRRHCVYSPLSSRHALIKRDLHTY